MTVWFCVVGPHRQPMWIRSASKSGAKVMAGQMGERVQSLHAVTQEEIELYEAIGGEIIDAVFNAEPGDPGILDLRESND